MILQTLGSNFYLKDKKLHIDLIKPYFLIKNNKDEIDKEMKKLEPLRESERKIQSAYIFASNPILSRLVDDVRIFYYNQLYNLPHPWFHYFLPPQLHYFFDDRLAKLMI